MTESDRQFFVKLLELDPVHQDLPEELVAQYDLLEGMASRAGSTLKTDMKILFCFLWSDENPRDLLAEIPPPREIQEGDKVFVTNWTKAKLARLGTVVSIAGRSEKGKIRVALKGDNKAYREIAAENVHYIPE